MANNKLPPEIHLIHGSKGMNAGTLLPEKLKKRIPFAEWGNDPSHFTREKFIEETAEYLHDVYGIGSEQDRHTLMMLADQIETYVNARAQQSKVPLVVKINDGKTLAPNPYLAISNEAMKNAIKIMNELGLTPKSRLEKQAPEENGYVAKFLRGPKG